MHIFKDEKSAIQKYTWRNGNKTIGQQVKESIEANKFPVFISEGTTEHKLKRIKENCQKQQQIPFQEKFCNDSMDLNLFQFYLFDFKEY